MPPAELRLRPIGVVRSPHKERFAAPRQPGGTPTPHAATATIELRDDLADATRDLACFSHIWLIYWLHLNRGWNPLVRPPGRGGTPRGLLATRAPHRPNPIGLSALRLIACDRTNLTVEAGDLLDGTPVLDIKPYLPYCDRIDQANSGWLQPPSPSAPHGVRS
ncbi:MAG: tRNA (N6-threonylcarbamoyladenosine(37)-N6)-methyltransferase TrmO [Zetaproteobacteria bacterium]|nr:MAG: tRNA (N6-threonylcarbamoyladenosine(37)-N6)-methyltransferase TrmO [Zetaproteobacteria bacterium]